MKRITSKSCWRILDRKGRKEDVQVPEVVLRLNAISESSADLIAAFVIVINECGQRIDAAARILHDRFIVRSEPCDTVPNKQKENVSGERGNH